MNLRFRAALAVAVLLAACHRDRVCPTCPAVVPDAAVPEVDSGAPSEDDAGVAPDAAVPEDAATGDAASEDAALPEDGGVEPEGPWQLTFPEERAPKLVSIGREVWAVSDDYASDEAYVTVRRIVAGHVAESWTLPGIWGDIATDGAAAYVLIHINDVTEVLGESLGEPSKDSLVVMRMQPGGTTAWKHTLTGRPDVHPYGMALDAEGRVVLGYVSADIWGSDSDQWAYGLYAIHPETGEYAQSLLLPHLASHIVAREDGAIIVSGLLSNGERFANHLVEDGTETFVARLARDWYSYDWATWLPGYRTGVMGLHEGDPIVHSTEDDLSTFIRLSGEGGLERWRYSFVPGAGYAFFDLVPHQQGSVRLYGHYEQGPLPLGASASLADADWGGDLFLATLDGTTGRPEAATALPGPGFATHGNVLTMPDAVCPIVSGDYSSTLTLGGLELPDWGGPSTGFIVTLCE